MPKNRNKYIGDSSNIIFRSSWELATFIWLDKNSAVTEWSSETTIVKYRCPIDKKIHRYFVDLKIVFNNREVYLVEIKPKTQTMPPKEPKRVTKRYITEVLTHSRNEAKWKAAREYAEINSYKFYVWTEENLKALGVKLL